MLAASSPFRTALRHQPSADLNIAAFQGGHVPGNHGVREQSDALATVPGVEVRHPLTGPKDTLRLDLLAVESVALRQQRPQGVTGAPPTGCAGTKRQASGQIDRFQLHAP